MITHEIQVVKETNNNHLWPYSASSPKTMSKIEYATYIEDIKSKFKVGDVLIGNFDADSPVRDMNNFNLFRFNILKDIQELHQHVKYINGKPECLYVQNLGSYHGGITGYWTSPNTWEVVPYDKLPEKVKQVVDARNSSLPGTH